MRTILSSGISVGSFLALVLNLVRPKSEGDRMVIEPQFVEPQAEAMTYEDL